MTNRPPDLEPFSGFGPDAIQWFAQLEADNSKPYFTKTKDLWQEQIRTPIEALLWDLAEKIGGEVKVYRPYRDVRFSKDKSPYKTSTYGVVMPEGSATGLYAGISSSGFGGGAGMYGMEKDQLERFRDAIAGDHGGDLAAIVETIKSAGYDIEGDALKTAPRGYPKDHEHIDLLRMKEIWVSQQLPETEDLTNDAPLRHMQQLWTTALPLIEFLDSHVGASGQEGQRPSAKPKPRV